MLPGKLSSARLQVAANISQSERSDGRRRARILRLSRPASSPLAAVQYPLRLAISGALNGWTSHPLTAKQATHAPPPLRLVRRRRRQTACGVDPGRRVVCREFVLSSAARHHADSDVARAPEARLVLRGRLHVDV